MTKFIFKIALIFAVILTGSGFGLSFLLAVDIHDAMQQRLTKSLYFHVVNPDMGLLTLALMMQACCVALLVFAVVQFWQLRKETLN